MIKIYKKYGYPILLVINALLLYVYLFKAKVIPLGWDTQFHLNRIEELYRSIQTGHVFSSTGTYTFSSIGLAINRFYPYLFLYLFAILRFIFNPIIAYNLGCFILTLASLFISYLSVRSLTKSNKTAFLFSVIYNNSGYLLLQISMRGDIAEYIALILLPLIFVGYKKLFSSSYQWLWLPLGMILVCYNHILSVMLFTFFLLCLFVLEYNKITLLVIKRLLISIGITAVFCLPLLVTMLRARSRTSVIIPIVPDVLINEALSPSTLLLNSLNNASPNNLLDVNLGLVVTIVSVFGILVFKSKNQNLINLECLGIFFVVLSTNIFPWFVFQNTPLNVIQFPWRFLGLATLCFSLVFAKLCSTKTNWIISMVWLITCMISFTYIHQYIYNSQAVQKIDNISLYRKIATNAVYTDYMPSSALNGMNKSKVFRSRLNIHKHVANVNGKNIQLSEKNIVPKYNSIQYKFNGLKKGKVNKIILPVLNYGENHSVSGIKVKPSANGETVITFVPKRSTQVIDIYVK